jgi:hypothetical protein
MKEGRIPGRKGIFLKHSNRKHGSNTYLIKNRKVLVEEGLMLKAYLAILRIQELLERLTNYLELSTS